MKKASARIFDSKRDYADNMDDQCVLRKISKSNISSQFSLLKLKTQELWGCNKMYAHVIYNSAFENVKWSATMRKFTL